MYFESEDVWELYTHVGQYIPFSVSNILAWISILFVQALWWFQQTDGHTDQRLLYFEKYTKNWNFKFFFFFLPFKDSNVYLHLNFDKTFKIPKTRRHRCIGALLKGGPLKVDYIKYNTKHPGIDINISSISTILFLTVRAHL